MSKVFHRTQQNCIPEAVGEMAAKVHVSMMILQHFMPKLSTGIYC